MQSVPAVRTDPRTGRKVFATRSAAAHPGSAGSGFAVVRDPGLTALPEASRDVTFDDAQRERYRSERDARRDAAGYVGLDGDFERYARDVFSTEPVERESLDDECDVLVVGAGFAALVLCHRLQEAGFDDIRFCERGGDVGGTWYWNRYPGVACDIEAYSYLPLLDEMGYIPSRKFASGFEIYQYCRLVAERIGFYDRCLFNTAVDEASWDGDAKRWIVTTDRGDRMSARILVLANGVLTTPKLARIPGMETFQGDSFHTSRWDYSVDLEGKRIGVIGTGATAVQIVPELAKVADELYVFQRTPSTIDVRGQRATTDEERERWANEPGWAKARRERFARLPRGRAAMLADDDYLSGKVELRERPLDPNLTPQEALDLQLQANFRLMERMRARVDELVGDNEAAELLKPYYTYGCKRPTFHDEYLPTFRRPNVHLVDTAPAGVERINESGVVHGGTEYPVDVLVYATGFQWMDSSTFTMVRGEKGESLSEKWKRQGTTTFLGLHSSGFPNLFVMTGPQGGGGGLNFTDGIEAHSEYVTWMLSQMRERGVDVVDVTESAELEWAEHCRDADLASAPLRDCSSYYNRDGEAQPGSLTYYGGADTWRRWWNEAGESGEAYVFSGGDAGRESAQR